MDSPATVEAEATYATDNDAGGVQEGEYLKSGLDEAGVTEGTIGIVDGDVVDLSNLQRQIIHTTADVDKWKVESAKETQDDAAPGRHARR